MVLVFGAIENEGRLPSAIILLHYGTHNISERCIVLYIYYPTTLFFLIDCILLITGFLSSRFHKVSFEPFWGQLFLFYDSSIFYESDQMLILCLSLPSFKNCLNWAFHHIRFWQKKKDGPCASRYIVTVPFGLYVKLAHGLVLF